MAKSIVHPDFTKTLPTREFRHMAGHYFRVVPTRTIARRLRAVPGKGPQAAADSNRAPDQKKGLAREKYPQEVSAVQR
jgi:hypothetical protein